MAKAGKLGKLLKKMQSFGKASSQNRSNNDHHHTSLSRRSSTVAATNSNHYDDDSSEYSPTNNNLCPVYVGKTRRRYMVSSHVLDHPLFRELVDRSSNDNVNGYCDEISVGCEVVLFEHLLWMLENADPQPESLDELVDFYAC